MKVTAQRLLILAWVIIFCGSAYADWMPDPALRAAVREAIGLPPAAPLTKDKMLWFDYLHAWDKGIRDLTGIEYATRLRDFNVCGNQISDITPLADLIHLEYLGLCGGQISDISPLANLVRLKGLDLGGNNISDITPLRNLVDLEWINLAGNPIDNIEILANFRKLTSVRLDDTSVYDFTPLSGLTLTEFIRNEFCEIAPVGTPVIERIENRDYPSIALPGSSLVAENPLRWFPGDNHELKLDAYAKHDLAYFGTVGMYALSWVESTEDLPIHIGGDLTVAVSEREQYSQRNPNFIYLPGATFHLEHSLDFLPPDSDFWLRSPTGKVLTNENPWDEYLLDLLNPKVQQFLINRIVAVATCGLFDGVLIDGLFLHGARYAGDIHRGREEEVITAHANILKGVRERVRADFLILVNGSRTKLRRYAEWINGSFMEMVRDYEGGYTYKGILEIEDTLRWNEEHLREPRINVLEGHGVNESFKSPNNLRWMRLFTTMSLTLSDGYSIFRAPKEIDGYMQHVHIWYDFWDADLGRPIGEKGKRYNNRDGVFIREFTNGWAVYNRSGVAQTIRLPIQAIGVASRQQSKVHIVSDLDGEIFFRSMVDLNADGVVNILDLVIVANAFGEAEPDLNADGVVNILDLVIVANAF